MAWVTIIWSMAAAASAMLALMHWFVWLQQRSRWSNFLLSVCALSAGAVALLELAMMRAQTPAEYGERLRWVAVPLSLLGVGIVLFVRRHFGVGRASLGWAVAVSRLAVVVLTFALYPNIHYVEITGLKQVQLFAGESIVTAVGPVRPIALVSLASWVALIAFVADATFAAWRRGDRRETLVVCAVIALILLVSMGFSFFTIWGYLQSPYVIGISYMMIVFAMAYRLSSDVVNAAVVTAELKRSEHRAQQIIEAVPNAIILVGQRGDIVLLNTKTTTLFGYTREELIGQSVDLLVPERSGRERDGYMAWPTGQLSERGREHFGVRKDGSQVPLEIGLSPVVTSEGTFVLVSMVDLTQRRQADREAQNQRAELAHLSRVAMLGELSGSLAHELNQPLAAILSNAEAAQQFLSQPNPNMDEVRAILADIIADDTRAGEVIRRIRLLLTKGELNRQETDLNEIVNETLRLVHSELVNRDVAVEVVLGAELPACSADRVQLQQVLMNLIVNACDAMVTLPPSERRLMLRTERIDGDGVKVSVVDCGHGIPPEDLERIFGSFVTTKSNGMGLGLAVCRTIISAHQGKLWASNNDATGATFHLVLPRDTPASDA